VIFAPATSGSLTGTATVVSNATNSPTTISLAGSGAALATHSVNLSWSAGTSSAVGSYVYRGTQAGGPYTRLNSSLVTSTSYSDGNVLSGQTYYYVATDVDSSGLESSYSSEAFATIP
jgi:fibronectin type 3 domain-containing protein